MGCTTTMIAPTFRRFLLKTRKLVILNLEIFERNSVHREKKNDVKKLLQKHFGEKWREDRRLGFFIHVLDVAPGEVPSSNKDENEEQLCEVNEESAEFIV